MKLLDDPKISTARWNPRRTHHSYKPLDVAAEMGLKLGRPYCTRHRHHHLNTAPTNLDPKNEKWSPQNRGRSPPTDENRDPLHLQGLKTIETSDLRRCRREAQDPIAGCLPRSCPPNFVYSFYLSSCLCIFFT
jgi:hypothetical protein